MQSILTHVERLTDTDLLERVAVLAGCERQSTVELIGHLAELDKRRLYRGEGFASLFSYCTRVLRLSEQAAYKRIVAARASRRFPVLLERLASGSINLSTLCLIAPIMTDDNYVGLLTGAAERSKRDVEVLVARLAPKPDAPATMRKLPTAAPATLPSVAEPPGRMGMLPHLTCEQAQETANMQAAERIGLSVSAPDAVNHPAPSASTAVALLHPERRPEIVPLTPERFRVQFTVSRETEEKLRRVQDLLRREIPNGDPATIFERALTLLLEDIARRKLAATTRPRVLPASDPRSRHVPAEIKRQVWLRDGGQCAFVARSGRRCDERALLEFHHLEPHAIGGETIVDNLSLRCRSHNLYEAQLAFGAFIPGTRKVRDA